MYKKSIIRGAVILTAANLITRIMGFFYRVYMSDAIGSEGMGLYQLVMPIYLLSWSVTSSGFSTAGIADHGGQCRQKAFCRHGKNHSFGGGALYIRQPCGGGADVFLRR